MDWWVTVEGRASGESRAHHGDGTHERAIDDLSAAFPVHKIEQNALKSFPDAPAAQHYIPPQV